MIPEDLVEALFEDPASERSSALMEEHVGLPYVDKIPRPGEARSWELRDWEDLAKQLKMEGPEKTAHSYKFTHPVFPSLIFAVASTPGDIKGAQNCMSDFRQEYLRVYTRLCSYLVHWARRGCSDIPMSEILKRSAGSVCDRRAIGFMPSQSAEELGSDESVVRKSCSLYATECALRFLRQLNWDEATRKTKFRELFAEQQSVVEARLRSARDAVKSGKPIPQNMYITEEQAGLLEYELQEMRQVIVEEVVLPVSRSAAEILAEVSKLLSQIQLPDNTKIKNLVQELKQAALSVSINNISQFVTTVQTLTKKLEEHLK